MFWTLASLETFPSPKSCVWEEQVLRNSPLMIRNVGLSCATLSFLHFILQSRRGPLCPPSPSPPNKETGTAENHGGIFFFSEPFVTRLFVVQTHEFSENSNCLRREHLLQLSDVSGTFTFQYLKLDHVQKFGNLGCRDDLFSIFIFFGS